MRVFICKLSTPLRTGTLNTPMCECRSTENRINRAIIQAKTVSPRPGVSHDLPALMTSTSLPKSEGGISPTAFTMPRSSRISPSTISVPPFAPVHIDAFCMSVGRVPDTKRSDDARLWKSGLGPAGSFSAVHCARTFDLFRWACRPGGASREKIYVIVKMAETMVSANRSYLAMRRPQRCRIESYLSIPEI